MESKFNVRYYDVILNDEFPINCFEYVQKYRTRKNMHYHDCFEFGVCLEGNGVFFIDNENYIFRPGSISVISPKCPHIAQSPDERPSKWLFISADLEALELKSSLKSYLTYDEDICNILKILYKEISLKNDNYQDSSLLLLKYLLIRADKQSKSTDSLMSDYSNLIMPAINYIQINYMNDININQLADMCHISAGYFRKIFKLSTNQTPYEFITAIRLQMAKIMITSGCKSITEIASEIGYNSISSFNRQFRNKYGLQPTKCRNTRL